MNDIYTYTVPVFIKALKGLDKCLEKAEAYISKQEIDEALLINDSLAPDMFPFKRQVQIACDNAKNGIARLVGEVAPSHEDNEETITELRERLVKTIAYIESVPESKFTDAHDQKIELPYFQGKYMTGAGYTQEYLIPNFFFHVAIAYGLIRKNGVDIGKADYIFSMPLRDIETV